jgi:hypothetical protein
MRRIALLLVVALAATGLSGVVPAGATTVNTPWGKDDTVGEAFRPQGDVERVVVENGRQRVTFTFRMAAVPLWDTVATSRDTVMRFFLDWRGTTAPHDRQVTATYGEGAWHVIVRNGNGDAICLRTGGVQQLSNHRYRFTVASCLGGAHVLRVAARFDDDQADDASKDIKRDRVPNSGGYGPFIRLPA